ncbi:MAG: hypothetical protein WCW31_04835 [Patescibacteria group bacterium]
MESNEFVRKDSDGIVSLRYSSRPPPDLSSVDREFRVHVAMGTPLPPIADLRRQFPGLDNVSGIFDGRPFHEHASRANANKKPGLRVMIPKCFNREIESEAAIEEMYPLGLIPVGVRGAYDFLCSNSEFVRLYWFLAVGEHARGACYDRLVPALSGGPECLTLGSRAFENLWDAQKLFLFERK